MRVSLRSMPRTLLMLSLSFATSHCGDKTDDNKSSAKMVLKVRNTGTLAVSNPGLTKPVSRSINLVDTPAGNLSFTPESFKLWINTIVLQNDSGLSNQFYTCDTTADDCEVDFGSATSIAAFEAKLSSLTVGPGTYTKVWLSCSPTSGGYIKFKGHTTLADGTVRYTADADANAGSPITSDAAKYGTLKITMTGGSCGLTMPLAKPVVVAETATSDSTKEGVSAGATLTMTLFSNLQDVVYYSPNVSGGMGGCTLDRTQPIPANAQDVSGPGFCSAYPSVFPYFGETTPTVEYYKVANTKASSDDLTLADANVLVKVIKDADGKPFWASFGAFYLESTIGYGVGDKGISGYTNSVTAFAVNADSTLTIKSQDDGFAAFQRAAHTGEVRGGEVVAGAGTGNTVTYQYKAFPYTP